jgi:hypothetical protein
LPPHDSPKRQNRGFEAYLRRLSVNQKQWTCVLRHQLSKFSPFTKFVEIENLLLPVWMMFGAIYDAFFMPEAALDSMIIAWHSNEKSSISSLLL